MKTLLTLSCAILAAVSFAQVRQTEGSGNARKETRSVPVFSQIVLEGAIEAEVFTGSKPGVTLQFDDNLLRQIETRVEGDKLIIRPKGSYTSKLELKAWITLPQLKGAIIRGSGNLIGKNISTPACALAIEGVGDITLTGKVGTLSATVSGSGSMALRQFQAQSVNAIISGTGSLDLYASKSLNGNISGTGSIKYAGSPKVKSQVSGTGTISKN